MYYKKRLFDIHIRSSQLIDEGNMHVLDAYLCFDDKSTI